MEPWLPALRFRIIIKIHRTSLPTWFINWEIRQWAKRGRKSAMSRRSWWPSARSMAMPSMRKSIMSAIICWIISASRLLRNFSTCCAIPRVKRWSARSTWWCVCPWRYGVRRRTAWNVLLKRMTFSARSCLSMRHRPISMRARRVSNSVRVSCSLWKEMTVSQESMTRWRTVPWLANTQAASVCTSMIFAPKEPWFVEQMEHPTVLCRCCATLTTRRAMWTNVSLLIRWSIPITVRSRLPRFCRAKRSWRATIPITLSSNRLFMSFRASCMRFSSRAIQYRSW